MRPDSLLRLWRNEVVCTCVYKALTYLLTLYTKNVDGITSRRPIVAGFHTVTQGTLLPGKGAVHAPATLAVVSDRSLRVFDLRISVRARLVICMISLLLSRRARFR